MATFVDTLIRYGDIRRCIRYGAIRYGDLRRYIRYDVFRYGDLRRYIIYGDIFKAKPHGREGRAGEGRPRLDACRAHLVFLHHSLFELSHTTELYNSP